jgi:hypothetical protein
LIIAPIEAHPMDVDADFDAVLPRHMFCIPLLARLTPNIICYRFFRSLRLLKAFGL